MHLPKRYIHILLVVLALLLWGCGGKERTGVEAGNAKIAGVVLDAQSQPVSGAFVRLYEQNSTHEKPSAIDTTDLAGQYELNKVEQGSYSLEVIWRDSLWSVKPVLDIKKTVVIDVQLPVAPIAPAPEAPVVGTRGTFIDIRDGQVYPWVTIGAQKWMAKNLNYSGDNGIGIRTFEIGWCYGSSVTDTSLHDELPTCDEYGRLYNWSTAMILPDSCETLFCATSANTPYQGICPEGWYLPDTLAFMELDSFVRAEQMDTLGVGFSERFLKEASADTNWNHTPFVSTDPYGFAMKPGGKRILLNVGMSEGGLGSFGYLWTSSTDTMYTGDHVWEFNSTVMTLSAIGKSGGAASIRCMR